MHQHESSDDRGSGAECTAPGDSDSDWAESMRGCKDRLNRMLHDTGMPSLPRQVGAFAGQVQHTAMPLRGVISICCLPNSSGAPAVERMDLAKCALELILPPDFGCIG